MEMKSGGNDINIIMIDTCVDIDYCLRLVTEIITIFQSQLSLLRCGLTLPSPSSFTDAPYEEQEVIPKCCALCCFTQFSYFLTFLRVTINYVHCINIEHVINRHPT